MYGVLLDANMCDVALAQLAVGVDLAEAGLDDAPLLVLEALGARRTGGLRTLRLLRHGRRSQTRLRVHGAMRAGRVEGRVGAIAHVAEAVGRRMARHAGGEEGVAEGATVSCGRSAGLQGSCTAVGLGVGRSLQGRRAEGRCPGRREVARAVLVVGAPGLVYAALLHPRCQPSLSCDAMYSGAGRIAQSASVCYTTEATRGGSVALAVEASVSQRASPKPT